MVNTTHIHLVTGLAFDKSKSSVIWLFVLFLSIGDIFVTQGGLNCDDMGTEELGYH